MSDLAFLTEDLVVIASNSVSDKGKVTFEVRCLKTSVPLFRCKFPLLDSVYTVQFLKHPASNHGPSCPTQLAKMFVPDPTIGVLGILISVTDGSSSAPILVVLSVHQFLRKCLVSKGATTGNNGDASRKRKPDSKIPIFPWVKWGLHVTRWFFPEIHGECGSRTVYGARMLAILGKNRDSYYMLLDFNPRPIRRGTQRIYGADEFKQDIVERETRMGICDLTISSSLPIVHGPAICRPDIQPYL